MSHSRSILPLPPAADSSEEEWTRWSLETGAGLERLRSEQKRAHDAALLKVDIALSRKREYAPEADAALPLSVAVCLPELGGELRRDGGTPGPGFTIDALYRAIEKGELSAVKKNGKWLVTRAAIREWLAREEAVPQKPSRSQSIPIDAGKTHRERERATAAVELAKAKLAEARKNRKH
ncbi:helix-turn-helix domain-containing protein [Rhizobium sp. CBK13]|uniref:helix-turn-helix domain-containing protein n=1 Tax=Rhizobium sp. CBK13 TaxID=3031399 RepID=UPI0023AF6DAD|nr:helix-turn-helix domain-containing protein [Rhizobium sp. CBK13]MDE8762561.1 helix-turn-helix domain-containing protein [Rhizobium sp. CBK13]